MRLSDSHVKKNVFFTVLFVLAFLLSASVLPYATVPLGENKGDIGFDLLFALSIVTGMVYENRRAAAIIALVFGALSDFFITPPIHLSPLLFLLGAYFGARALGVFFSANAATAAVASIPFFLLRSLVGGVYLSSHATGAGLSEIIRTVLLPELCCNVAAVFVTYLIVNFLYKIFKRRFCL